MADRLVTGSSDGTVRVWKLNGEEQFIYQGHFDAVSGVVFAADDQEIYSTSKDNTIRIWDAKGRPGTREIRPHSDTLWAVRFTNDQQFAVSASEDGTVAITDLKTEQLTKRISKGVPILSLALSPDRPIGAFGTADGVICIFEVSSGRILEEITAHRGYIWDLDFSTNGTQLASAGSDGTGKIFETRNWGCVGQLDDHQGELGVARFSPDGKWIVTCSDDRTVKLWDANQFRLVHTFTGHTHPVWRTVFTPDSQQLVSSSFDGEYIVWDLKSQEKISGPVKAHVDQIAGLSLTPDGRRIVTASDDGTIKIWDIATGIELFVLRDRGGAPIVAVEFSKDGQRMISGNSSGLMTIRSSLDAEGFASEFLPRDGVKICTDGMEAVTRSPVSDDTYRKQLQLARQCSSHFPSYVSFTIEGIANYRLGNFAAAVESLEEAQRIEPLEYNQADLRPDIEGYLAMAYLQMGQLDSATATRKIFNLKASEHFSRDAGVAKLRQEVDQLFQALVAARR